MYSVARLGTTGMEKTVLVHMTPRMKVMAFEGPSVHMLCTGAAKVVES